MDKRRMAAAIEYNPDDHSPKVNAKGAGLVADKLLEKGKEESVPVISDPKLLSELMGIGVGDFIPPDLYAAVAQVLVFVGELDRRENRGARGRA
jgi:flagellar biosynthesis protein